MELAKGNRMPSVKRPSNGPPMMPKMVMAACQWSIVPVLAPTHLLCEHYILATDAAVRPLLLFSISYLAIAIKPSTLQ